MLKDSGDCLDYKLFDTRCEHTFQLTTVRINWSQAPHLKQAGVVNQARSFGLSRWRGFAESCFGFACVGVRMQGKEKEPKAWSTLRNQVGITFSLRGVKNQKAALHIDMLET